MPETWRGIYPITSFVLDALQRKRDGGVDGAMTAREQILLTAVEFWAAAAHGTLYDHMQPEPTARLAEARQAFAAIGAVRIASLLRVATEELDDRTGRKSVAALISELDERLARTDDNVDELIGRYVGGSEESLAPTSAGLAT
jgi:hypothetical protein